MIIDDPLNADVQSADVLSAAVDAVDRVVRAAPVLPTDCATDATESEPQQQRRRLQALPLQEEPHDTMVHQNRQRPFVPAHEALAAAVAQDISMGNTTEVGSACTCCCSGWAGTGILEGNAHGHRPRGDVSGDRRMGPRCCVREWRQCREVYVFGTRSVTVCADWCTPRRCQHGHCLRDGSGWAADSRWLRWWWTDNGVGRNRPALGGLLGAS